MECKHALLEPLDCQQKMENLAWATLCEVWLIADDNPINQGVKSNSPKLITFCDETYCARKSHPLSINQLEAYYEEGINKIIAYNSHNKCNLNKMEIKHQPLL